MSKIIHTKITKQYLKKIASSHKILKINSDYAKIRGLEIQPEAKKLVFAGMEPHGRDHFLAPPAAKAWQILKKQAKKDKIKIILMSGFRSVERQHYIIEEKIRKGSTIVAALERLAAPGYSEHHTGFALDLAHPDDPNLDERFEKTDTFEWLTKVAPQLGFTMSFPRNNKLGFIYEPWHWRFGTPTLVGKSLY